MHRKVRQYLKKSLCGILSAAMLLTSLSVPDNTVRAAEVSAVEETEMSEESAGADEIVEFGESKVSEEAAEPDETKESEETITLDETKEQEEIKESDEVDESTEEESESKESTVVESETGEFDTVKETDKNFSDSDEVDTTDEKILNIDETENCIINGDFSDDQWKDSKLSSWGFAGDSWNVVGSGNIWIAADAARDENGKGMALNYDGDENGGTVEVYQTIKLLPAGKYKMTAYIKENNSKKTNAKLYHGSNISIEGAEANDATELSTEWVEICYEFTIDAPKTNYNVGFAVSSEKGAFVCIDDVSLYCTEPIETEPIEYTYEQLQSLCNEANKYKEEKYTPDSWNVFKTALDEANKLESGSLSQDITNAYVALQKAISELLFKITFYFYIGNTQNDIGVILYGDFSTPISESDDWWFWQKKVHPISSEGTSGWYKIEFNFPEEKANESGFVICEKDSESGSEKYKCVSGWQDANSEHYAKLISGEAQFYAVKEGTLYQGTDDIISSIDQIDRNVTLHVYSESGTPAIATSSPLSCVADGDGVKKIELLSVSKEDSANSKYYYDMKKDADDSNWYSLTFIAPIADDSSKVICELYIKGEDGTYTKNVSFTDGTISDESTVDFTPVLGGTNTYYNDGEFFSDPALATGVSMQDLENEYKKYQDYNAAKYTEESWKVLSEALDTAKEVIDRKEEAALEDIKNAYNALKEAAEKLELASIQFYYYVGDTDNKEVGVYRWNMEFNADVATWHPWGTEKETAYKMTKSEYPGWYSIQLKATETPSEDANFQIFVESDLNTPVFLCGSEGNKDNGGNVDIYNKLYSGEQTTYAVREFGEGDTKTAKLYEGLDTAQTAMRSITLYAYSETGTPAVGASVELSALNESTGELSKLAASKTEGSIHYYNMTPEAASTEASKEESANWYKLTFSMPVLEENTDAGLYTLAEETYTLDKKFAEKDAEGAVNITPVFGGNVYYREGQLYKSKEEAAGITLRQLKEYLESEEVTAVVKNGESMYTAESWEKFQSAKTKAEELAAKIEANGEGYKDAETTAAYSALKEAVENMVSTGKVVNLYYYSEALNDYADTDTEKYGLYLSVWSNQKVSSTKEEIQLSQGEWAYSAYAFEKVTDEAINYGYDNWYSVPVKLIAANDGADKDGFLIQTGKAVTADGATTHTALESDAGLIKISFWENKAIYDSMSALENGGTIAVKGTNTYTSIYEAENVTIDKLLALYEKAAALDEKDYLKGEQWDQFQTALAAAKAVIDKEKPSAAEIDTAYNTLNEAMDALVYSRTAEINVKKVALAEDFITGADLSSYIALKDSGVVFRDENGKPLSDSEFFSYLRDGGMNWVRIRIWNDPYNSSGNGYGGGNNDLEKAIRLGQMVTNAGMRVLIDFHYSDFWADPKKQKAPKAWAGYSIEEKETAVYQFTLDSLNTLRSAGVDVGMVQVGNETNNGIAGETVWDNMAKLFKAGSRAVREFDKNCLVAVHFTDPQKGYADIAKRLNDSEIDYDVFGSSYYPFGHGDAANLKSVLEYIVETYGKKVMAAETSWPTTLTDGDGYGFATPPSIPEMYKDQDYGVSVQGQADEMQELISKVNEINDTHPGKSIGVFYWEPAWISPYYIKDGDGNDNDSLYKQNFDLWEKYGSGWASSYAAEYDPDDAGVWFGGSAMDNSSWFDFDGTALPTAQIYSLVRTGASTERRISSVDSNPVLKLGVGEKIDWSTVTVTAKYNDGTSEQKTVTWDEDEQRLVNIYKAGAYIVHGIVSTEDKEYKIKLTVQVTRSAVNNILLNPDFESGVETPWVIDTRLGHGSAETDPVAGVTGEDPHSGAKGLHFWSAIGLDMTVSQTIQPEAGIYTFGGYIQGGGADREDVQYAYVTIRDKDGKVKSNLRASFTLDGWKNWSNPEITGISVEEGDSMEVGLLMKSTQDGAWGTIDDFYLYGEHTISVENSIQHGTVTANVVKANSGERIYITVTPESGYYPETLTLTGASVKADTLASSNGTVVFNPAAEGSTSSQAVLTYTKNAEEKTEIFMMPNGNVTVSAVFKSIFDGNNKISLNAKDAEGRYLVQVNGIDGENPIEHQFHTGKAVQPALVLSYMGYELTTADYSVTYDNNKALTTDAAKAKLTLTAKGSKFEGTREILFDIVADTRKTFDKKTIQVVYVTPDKFPTNEKVVKPSDAVYYLGKQKAVEPKIKLYAAEDIALATPIDDSLYEVHYQNNKKTGKAALVVLPSDKALKDPNGYKEGSVTTAFTIAKCPLNQENVEVIVSKKPSYYTGKKIEHSITVKYTYHEWIGGEAKKKTVTLAKGTDYAIAYTNNVNANVYYDGSAYIPVKPNKAPAIKITGKGNFTGARTTEKVTPDGKPSGEKLTFDIRPKQIGDTVVTVGDLAEKPSAQTPKITVKDGTKVLPASQYRIKNIVKTHDQDRKPLPVPEQIYALEGSVETGTPKVQSAGTYEITIEGRAKTNYEGVKDKTNKNSTDKLVCRVVDKDHLIDYATVKVNGKFYYTGEQITLTAGAETSNLVVKAGKNKVLLAAREKPQNGAAEEDGYYVTYTNNVNAGKATVTITGTGSYIGTKTVTFQINKRTLVNTLAKQQDKLQKGVLQTPKLSEKGAAEKLDAVWIPAKENEKGVIVNSDNGKAGETGYLEVPYTGYTINPDFRFSAENYNLNGDALLPKELSSGDYTVSCKVGAWKDDKAPVTVTVKGKGNYSGSVKFENLFTLTARSLKDFNIDIAPATYNGSALKPSIVFYDKNTGKLVDLKLNTAYSVSYKNNKDTAVVNTNPDKQPEVILKVKGKGWKTDRNDPATTTWSKKFVIGQAEITSADVGDVVFQSFLGKAIKPKVTVKVNGKALKEGKDYLLTYSNNVKRGSKATLQITGKGNYYTSEPIRKVFVIK